MNILENFKDLFLEIWQQGIAGVNFTQIGLAIAIFLFFLLLRGLIAKFILQRLKNYVAKTSNKFDDALVEASAGPIKFIPIVLGIFMATSYMEFDGKMSVFVDNINRSLITILIFWLIHQIVEPITFLIKRVEELLSKDLLNWVIKANKILIIFFGFAATLDIWGIKIAPIIAGLGLEDLSYNKIIVDRETLGGNIVFKAKVYSSIVGYRAKLELVMKNDGLIVARIPGSPVDIPVVTLMRALGLESDKEIASVVSLVDELQDELEGSFEKAGDVPTAKDAIVYISKRIAPGMLEEFQIKRAETLLDWGLLPHLGKHPENRKEKAQFLGEAACKLS